MLKIAYISYEYTPDIGQGGIATYISHISRAMLQLGHYVEIFSGSPLRECSEIYNDVLTHRILCKNPGEFRENVVSKFEERHKVVSFDAFECAEINADGAYIKDRFPNLPLVVKLHAPTYLLIKLLNNHTSLVSKMRFLLGNLRQGIWRPWGKPDLSRDKDYIFTSKADILLSPSKSLKKIIAQDWRIPLNQINVIPNPYEPSSQTLSIPINRSYKIGANINILFIGKLNIQKGGLLLADLIPNVLNSFNNVNFTLVGGDGPSHLKGITMQSYLKQRIVDHDRVYFAGAVNLDEVPRFLSKSDIVIIPSLWENFPYVCLEAMSAGRAIIGSKNGGMSEMLANGAGILVSVNGYKELIKALELLISNPNKRIELGERAREVVLKEYNLQKVGKQLEGLLTKTFNKELYEGSNMH